MANDPQTTDAIEVQLAKGLLSIAYLAMPASYYQSDSRCELARKVLAQRGIEFNPSQNVTDGE
jgi:hypothetical protein